MPLIPGYGPQYTCIFPMCSDVFSIITTFIALGMLPYECSYLVHGLNTLSCRCYSLLLVYILYIWFWNVRPVCPMYFSMQSIHLISYTPLVSYLSICGCGFTMFCIVSFVRNAIFICASLKSLVSFFVSFPLYGKIVHFLVLQTCVFVVFLLF
jgi:hypothetical protein